MVEIKNYIQNLNFEFSSQLPYILKGNLSNELFDELNYFFRECESIKNHPLGFLRNHINAGKNRYQTSIPKGLLEKSFLMPFLIHLGEFYISEKLQIDISYLTHHRIVRMRQFPDHYDHYDFWVNFSQLEDSNNIHNHAGTLSGILYFTDTKLPVKFYYNDVVFVHEGKKGEVFLFPSNLLHSVDYNTIENNRISFSFNLFCTDNEIHDKLQVK
jgi:hypothetical protein